MWVVCALRADRSAEPIPVSGTWPNGAVMTAVMYPDKAVPLIDTYGEHESRDGAVRSLVSMYHPELKDDPIEHIKRVSKGYINGSLKTYKIVKLKV